LFLLLLLLPFLPLFSIFFLFGWQEGGGGALCKVQSGYGVGGMGTFALRSKLPRWVERLLACPALTVAISEKGMYAHALALV
jgi:hypothetical protein